MQFNINEWRRIYNRVQHLGKMLKESQPTYDEYKNYIEPIAELNRDTQDAIKSEISLLMRRSDHYLDVSFMTQPKPLWHYIYNDPKTHLSHEAFKYGHLI